MKKLTSFDLLFLAKIENSQEKDYIRTEMKSGTMSAKPAPFGQLLLDIQTPSFLEDEAKRRSTDEHSLKAQLKREIKSFGYQPFFNTGMYTKFH